MTEVMTAEDQLATIKAKLVEVMELGRSYENEHDYDNRYAGYGAGLVDAVIMVTEIVGTRDIP